MHSLSNVGPLEHGEVEVIDSLLTERSIYAGFVAEGPWVDLCTCRIHSTWRGEAGSIEPSRDSRDRAAGSVLVASRDVVRPEGALSQKA